MNCFLKRPISEPEIGWFNLFFILTFLLSFSCSSFDFLHSLWLTPWVQSRIWHPSITKGVPENCICCSLPAILTSSNNNLWPTMLKSERKELINKYIKLIKRTLGSKIIYRNLIFQIRYFKYYNLFFTRNAKLFVFLINHEFCIFVHLVLPDLLSCIIKRIELIE